VESLLFNLANGAALFAVEAEAEGAKQAEPSLLVTAFPLLLLGLVFYFLMIRPQRRDQAKRQMMLSAVKKNDRVVTIGGIYGVVTNIHREADELTIKVDEATNTKLRVTLSSVARVLGDEPTGEPANK
jgi:preprotein translocase subunit YajC